MDLENLRATLQRILDAWPRIGASDVRLIGPGSDALAQEAFAALLAYVDDPEVTKLARRLIEVRA